MSRVYLGIHFRYDSVAGNELGTSRRAVDLRGGRPVGRALARLWLFCQA